MLVLLGSMICFQGYTSGRSLLNEQLPYNFVKGLQRTYFRGNRNLKIVLYNAFSNLLIIHKKKTKEITTVTVAWIPDLN